MHLNFWEKRNFLKSWERGLFTGGPAPTNRPSQRSRPSSPAPTSPPSSRAWTRPRARARPHQDSGAAWLAGALADATTAPPPVDSASALDILPSTLCASSRSLSRSLACAPRAPHHRPQLELPEPPPPCSKCLASSQCLQPPLRAPHSLQRARTRSSRAGEPP